MLGRNRYILIFLCFVAGLYLLALNPNDNRPVIYENILREIKPNPDALVDSTTSIKRYKTVIDSLKNIETLKKERLMFFGEGWEFNFFGLRKLMECDTCTEFKPRTSGNGFKDKYFFIVNGYSLRKPRSSFIIENGRYYIKREKSDLNSAYIEYETSETKLRLGASFNPYEKSEMWLLVPISKGAYKFLDIFLQILFFPLVIILTWIVFIGPIATLYRISMGDSFNPKNARNLKRAGWSLVGFHLFPVVLAWVLKLILGTTLPKEIYFPGFLYINDHKGWLIGGICLLIVGSAFKAGLKLKEEQDLTI